MHRCHSVLDMNCMFNSDVHKPACWTLLSNFEVLAAAPGHLYRCLWFVSMSDPDIQLDWKLDMQLRLYTGRLLPPSALASSTIAAHILFRIAAISVCVMAGNKAFWASSSITSCIPWIAHSDL